MTPSMSIKKPRRILLFYPPSQFNFSLGKNTIAERPLGFVALTFAGLT